MLDRKNTTKVLIESAIDYYTHKLYACHKEIGVEKWGKYKVDLLCFNLKGELIACEIKSCKDDFKADHKMAKYLNYVNKLYIVCPSFLVDYVLDNLPDKRIGVFFLNTDGYLFCAKGAKRNNNLNQDIKNKMLLRLAYRSAAYTKRTRPRRTRRYLE